MSNIRLLLNLCHKLNAVNSDPRAPDVITHIKFEPCDDAASLPLGQSVELTSVLKTFRNFAIRRLLLDAPRAFAFAR